MFKESIKSTSFSSQYADRALNIYGSSYGDARDVTMLSTLRALLMNRVEGQFFFVFAKSDYSKGSLDGASTKTIANAILSNSYIKSGNYGLSVVNIATGDNEKVFRSIDEAMLSQLGEGYEYLERLTIFYKKSFEVRGFINHERKKAVLFVDKMDYRKLHFIQCSIPVFLPWYFDSNPLNDKEIRLLKSLAADSYTEYVNAIEDIASSINFREQGLRTMLKGFEARMFLRREGDIRSFVDNITNELDTRIRQIRDLLDKKREQEMLLLGYKQKAKELEDSHELLDYFLMNKNVIVEDVDDEDLTFLPFGYMTNWSDAEARAIIDNDYADMHSYGNGAYSHEDRKSLFKALFVDKTIKLRLCGAYRFRYGSTVIGLTGHDIPGELDTYMPNPHIDRYHCLGNYEAIINELITSGNYIMAIDQTIQSAMSLSLHDGAVMHEFYNSIFARTTRQCLELPDGTCVDTRGAIEWLKEQEGNNEQSN